MDKRKKSSSSTSNKRSKAQKSGFVKTNIPFDSGYVKPTKDGGRLHKRTKNGPIHKDKSNPSSDPVEHVVNYVIIKPIKK